MKRKQILIKAVAIGVGLSALIVLKHRYNDRKPKTGNRNDSLPNVAIYRFYAPIYDRLFGPVLASCRQQSLQRLALQSGGHLLISGVGTGLDLPFIPEGVEVTGVDISHEMLQQAARKDTQAQVKLYLMDAQCLDLPNESFDSGLLNLILSVAPDGGKVLQETWRVLRPGGRVVIFDKFLPEHQSLSIIRSLLGAVIRRIGTDPNRRFSEMLAQIPGAAVVQNEPALLSGQYRLIVLKKPYKETSVKEQRIED